ncbi:MAG: hypothetical protein QOH48_1146 [Actinomycetota bacterium]|jgi:hypothetical protein|nr:hypothetical protein [Actinomycetota bacterium]
MALLLIAVMIAALVSAVVRSKGRSFFKYAELSRTLESQDEPRLRSRRRAQDEPRLRSRRRAMR